MNTRTPPRPPLLYHLTDWEFDRLCALTQQRRQELGEVVSTILGVWLREHFQGEEKHP